jgi:OmpA-OmpF porin, OOP family
MKLKLTLIIALSVFSTSLFSQAKKGSLIGIHFNLADFKAPNGIKNPSSGNVYSSIKEMDEGVTLSYWRGLTSKIDVAVKANAMFYRIIEGLNDNSQIAVELEPTLNIRPFQDAAKVVPFLTAGVGVGLYNKKIGGYIPAGVGVQVNIQSLTYIFLQAQYKFTLTNKAVADNLFYSVGFAQNF